MKTPSQMVMEVPALDSHVAQRAAEAAVVYARRNCPISSGKAVYGIGPIWGYGFFGISWEQDYVWFQDQGVRPFTMRALQGKTIPMWIDDPSGKERAANPKAKVRTTAGGKTQVLIFRKVAYIGERKKVKRRIHGVVKEVVVPKSYPGAPGRIVTRELLAPLTTEGKKAGQIAKGNVGVRWYFPGLSGRYFLEHAVATAGADWGLAGALKARYDQLGMPDVVVG